MAHDEDAVRAAVFGRPEMTVSAPTADLPAGTAELTGEAAAAGEDLDRCLGLAQRWGPRVPLPGGGSTCERWHLLLAAAEGDLTAARVMEPHLDALAIFAEAGQSPPPGAWGVFAAEAPQALLRAEQRHRRWVLRGRKPWCSLAGLLDGALVTAHTAHGRALFAVDLKHPGVTARPGTWVARGLRAVDSGPVDFSDVPATPVGEPGWYLSRPGFAWGGIGVAACWAGGAAGLLSALRDGLTGRQPDRVRAANLGAADTAQFAAVAALGASATRIDAGAATGEAGELLAARVRAVVHDAAERVLREVGHALGPGPLAFDERYARRVADLEIYLRQHHAERDLADLGARLLTEAEAE